MTTFGYEAKEFEVFIATGAAIFHSARLGKASQVRINAVVHLKSYLEPGVEVPIGWIAVGNPARLSDPGGLSEFISPDFRSTRVRH